MTNTSILHNAQRLREKKFLQPLVSSNDFLPVFPLTVEITAYFSTGERAGRETYQLTRDQLNELASNARDMEAGNDEYCNY